MIVTFITKNNTSINAEFRDGDTLLHVAHKNNINLHDFCEGSGICGGCHVIIENHLDLLPQISDIENDALDRANGVTLKSRLACQIKLTHNLDGLIVRLPK